MKISELLEMKEVDDKVFGDLIILSSKPTKDKIAYYFKEDKEGNETDEICLRLTRETAVKLARQILVKSKKTDQNG